MPDQPSRQIPISSPVTRSETLADNPFEDSLVYSLGHRNPQGIGWAEDGTMFASEFGQDTWDELNIIVPGGNYGWPEVEGSGGAERGFIDPVQQWTPDEASPSGLAVTGGTVFVAGLGGERLFAIDAKGTVVVLAASPEFKLLGKNPLGERSQATPAVSGGKLLLRLPTRDRSVFAGDAVERRLKTLASVLGFEGSGFGKLPDRDD